MLCPCGSLKESTECCDLYISGRQIAPTAEALMRSRYTAHVIQAMAYLKETLAPEVRSQFKEKDVREWANSDWLGLEILSAEGNKVEFIAKYKSKGKVFEHHEVSKFRKIGERWFFVDGDSHVHEEGQGHHHHHGPQEPVVRESPKLGRNDPCSCGSGKKYKKCCAA
jgi:SEC-C motif domain protein